MCSISYCFVDFFVLDSIDPDSWGFKTKLKTRTNAGTATFCPQGLCGWSYQRQRPHCSAELKRIVIIIIITVTTVQERREREQQELESAKEIADDDFDDFPWWPFSLMITNWRHSMSYSVSRTLQCWRYFDRLFIICLCFQYVAFCCCCLLLQFCNNVLCFLSSIEQYRENILNLEKHPHKTP